ncbi:MAG TPA: CocE/NonD family hydrolase [Solirubrobacterales bacterium]|nr:CocE/NonD family hydrolase [Solirubrobacterales bacterium]
MPAAQAANIGSVFGGLTCTPDPTHGNVRVCGGYTKTFDEKTKIDVNVILPPAPTSGPDGPYPLIGDFHGWGGSKQGLTTIEPSPGLTFQQEDPRIEGWAKKGYAVFSMSDRGWGRSCGKYDPEPNVWTEACTLGYNHLMDDRYEVHDAQYLMSVLADEEVIQPKKIGVTGASYGGGLSMALAALRNRVMEGKAGTLEAWKSPTKHLEMEIAAAVPQWPWTDIAYALAPNGHNLDYVTESSYFGPNNNFGIGIAKASWIEGLYQAGLALSKYEKNDPEANIPGWRERLLAGEPYSDEGIFQIINMLTTDHSSFYINHAEQPSPLLIQSGWNDDLFPADEALRFYQRTRAQYPSDPISLFFMDDGHARSQNKAADFAVFEGRLEEWFAYYLKGEGSNPSSSVEAMTTVCPKSSPSEGPYTASDWSSLAPGEIRYQSAAAQTIEPGNGGPTQSSLAFNPVPNPETEPPANACNKVPATDQAGIANYRLAAAPAGGYTLMGSPTITATIQSASPNAHVVARLLDVSPEGEESLVARGLYRPVGGTQEIVFQLHPQGYHFAEGHVAKLELLPSDFPYSLSSSFQVPITVSNLELRLPVMQQPGSLAGLVQTPAPKVVPAGYTLAAEYQQKEAGGGDKSGGGGSTGSTPAATIKIGKGNLAGKIKVKGGKLLIPLSCSGEGACSGKATVTSKPKGKKSNTTLGSGKYSIDMGKKITLKLSLTKAGRKLVNSQSAKTIPGVVKLNDAGRPTTLTAKRSVTLS